MGHMLRRLTGPLLLLGTLMLVSGAANAGSSSIVSAILQSRYALVTGMLNAAGSCGIVSAKVRETCGRI